MEKNDNQTPQREHSKYGDCVKPSKKAKKKKGERNNGGKPRIWLIILGIAAAVVLGAALLGLKLLNSINRPASDTVFEAAEDDVLISPAPAFTPEPEVTPEPEATPEPTPLPMSELYTQTRLEQEKLDKLAADAADERYINVLLIGVDRRGTSGNSSADTVLIATIDTVHNRLKLTSVMRDMLVNIPGEGYGKFNSAASRGGTKLLIDTLNSSFNLNISEYVLVDFNMFQKIVDALGGVTVFMTAEEISAANDCIAGLNKQWNVPYLWDGFIFANEGNVLLTGKQALGYARIRHIDSDFSRTKRQFNLLNCIFAKFMASSVSRQYKFVEAMLPFVETNMTNERIISCASMALGMDVRGLLYCRIPADGLYENSKYDRKFVILSDLPANTLAMHSFIFDSAEEADRAEVLKPGESLPPRTPTIYQGADGNYYYYQNNMPVDQNVIYVDPNGQYVDQYGNPVNPDGTPVYQPQPTFDPYIDPNQYYQPEAEQPPVW